MSISRMQRSFIASTVALCYLMSQARGSTEHCEADGTCEAARCDIVPDASVCEQLSSIYGSGGTAMAYKPNQPESSVICDASDPQKYRIAGWPFSRSTWKNAPSVQLKINLFGCQAGGDTCCCHTLNEADIEIWQARPDGTYSSLSNEDKECRARSHTVTGNAVFQTVAPGSTGSLQGLGPNGWEFAPYGPPTIHILVKATEYDATLVDVLLPINMKTLEHGKFWGPDIRGSAWVRQKAGWRFSASTAGPGPRSLRKRVVRRLRPKCQRTGSRQDPLAKCDDR